MLTFILNLFWTPCDVNLRPLCNVEEPGLQVKRSPALLSLSLLSFWLSSSLSLSSYLFHYHCHYHYHLSLWLSSNLLSRKKTLITWNGWQKLTTVAEELAKISVFMSLEKFNFNVIHIFLYLTLLICMYTKTLFNWWIIISALIRFNF